MHLLLGLEIIFPFIQIYSGIGEQKPQKREPREVISRKLIMRKLIAIAFVAVYSFTSTNDFVLVKH